MDELDLVSVMDDLILWLEDDIRADPRQVRTLSQIQNERDLTRKALLRWPSQARATAQKEIDEVL
jgi:hypothetical protein